jgi:hypothetical protein
LAGIGGEVGSDGQRACQAMEGEREICLVLPAACNAAGLWLVVGDEGAWVVVVVRAGELLRVDSVREGSSGRKEHLAFQKIWWKERPETR